MYDLKKKHYIFYSILITYIFLIIGILVYFNFLYNFIPIPECPIHKYLGFFCPACGCTRALVSLVNMNPIQSFLYNPIVIYTFFISTVFLIVESINTFLHKNLVIPWKTFIYIGLIILVINCILQNTVLNIL